MCMACCMLYVSYICTQTPISDPRRLGVGKEAMLCICVHGCTCMFRHVYIGMRIYIRIYTDDIYIYIYAGICVFTCVFSYVRTLVSIQEFMKC